ncbi:MAG: metal-dependent hydrolase [Bacillota bacterium]
MEPLTHGVIGGLVALGAGNTVSLSEPAFIASVLGAMAPDLDIVYHLKGQLSYLENHRGKSHGPVGLILWSSLVTCFLALFFDDINWQTWVWALIGGISHTLMDAFNSYGIHFTKPGRSKKISFNLVQVFDPIILLLGVLGLVYSSPFHARLALLAIAGWMVVRYCCRKIGENKIRTWLSRVKGQQPDKIIVMPAMWGLWKWDFVAEFNSQYISGSWWMNTDKKVIFKEIDKVERDIKEKVLETEAGKFFTLLTPVYAITRERWQDREAFVLYDLRYLVGDRYLHRATVILNEQGQPLTQVIQPFTEQNCINL